MQKQKVGLIILDGLGFSKNTKANAFKLAKTPTIDYLSKNFNHCLLQASGNAVGLPNGQMGNSEVGHLTIGAGRTILSSLEWLNQNFKSKKIFNTNVFKQIKKLPKNCKLHLMGLASNGNVHASLNQMLQVLNFCINNKINTVLHLFGDGRDVKIDQLQTDLPLVLKKIKNHKNIKLATISGRFYAMDRDKRWPRISLALDALECKSKNTFKNPLNYIEQQRKINKSDEFITPAYNENYKKKEIALSKNDAILFLNFRADRARQICHCFKKSKLYDFKSSLWNLNLKLYSMIEYDGIKSDEVVYKKPLVNNTLGEIIAKNNLSQLRIAETEKYAHVTFFFDGGKEQKFKNEKKILIPSPKVKTYDLKPEMSAFEITKKLIANMSKFDFFVCNYANCDMVGHTGKLDKTIIAVETVDNCLKQVLQAAKKTNTLLLITADHGNCEMMIDKNNKVCTTHTTNPVFLVSNSDKLEFGSNISKLSDIAKIVLKIFKIKNPIRK